MSNYEPVIKGGDHGIWRRVKKMPWDYQIKPEEKDPDFAEKLKAEAPGILNWMLAGLRTYLEAGKKLRYCQRIADATEQYRQDMDLVGRFVTECLTLQSAAAALGKEVYRSCEAWCKDPCLRLTPIAEQHPTTKTLKTFGTAKVFTL